jgi:hypothetical protein
MRWVIVQRLEGSRFGVYGRPRDIPLSAPSGRTSDERKVARAAGDAPKRLPSRRWEQTGFVNVPNPFEDDDDDEDEYE